MATNFFQRWSSRKLASRDEQAANVVDEQLESDDLKGKKSEPSESPDEATLTAGNETQANREQDGEDTAPTLEDVADVNFETGVASFMKSNVEKSVKKAALRKLFHSEEFNYISEMDDCTGDYSNLTALDSDVTKQLRNWMDEVVDELEAASEPMVEDATGEQINLEPLDIQFEPDQLIEEAVAFDEHKSFPASAEGDTSDKTQEKQLVKEEGLIAGQEERS